MNNPVRISMQNAVNIKALLEMVMRTASAHSAPVPYQQGVRSTIDELTVAIADAEREERQRAELRKDMAQVETQIRPVGSPGQDGSQNSTCASKDLG